MVLNGINYTEKHLTDEEMAVVEAMRMGADVDLNFYHIESLEEKDERMDIFSGIKTKYFHIHDLPNSRSVAFTERKRNISVTVYVQVDK